MPSNRVTATIATKGTRLMKYQPSSFALESQGESTQDVGMTAWLNNPTRSISFAVFGPLLRELVPSRSVDFAEEFVC